MPDDDIALTEKRMYGARGEGTRAYVAAALGVAYVDVSDDQIGRFGLERRCDARDVAGADGRLVVATDRDVLVGDAGDLLPTDFGRAVAVGFADAEDGGDPVAAGPDGRIAELNGDDWVERAQLPPVRAIAAGRAATAEGVYDLDGVHLGLDDARDVAPGYAATGEGLFRRADGWNLERAGEATVVTREDGRVHGVVDGRLFERSSGRDGGDGGRDADGERWHDAGAPVVNPVDVAYGEATFAVDADGGFALFPERAKDGAPGWRLRELGLDDTRAVAVP